jgi:hypothetical protein
MKINSKDRSPPGGDRSWQTIKTDFAAIESELGGHSGAARAIADAPGAGSNRVARDAHRSRDRPRRDRSAVSMIADRDWWQLARGGPAAT